MIRSPAELRNAEHDRIAAQVDEFLARGGQIEVVPRGVSGDNLTPRQRVNPPGMGAEERAAKKAQSVAFAAPRREKAHAPRSRPQKPPRELPKIRQVYEQVRAGNQSAKGIAEQLGHDIRSTSARLIRLRVEGLVECRRGRQKQDSIWLAVA